MGDPPKEIAQERALYPTAGPGPSEANIPAGSNPGLLTAGVAAAVGCAAVALALLAAALLLSLGLMIRHFGIHRRVSIVGTVFVVLFVMHGITAIPYAMGLVLPEYLGFDVAPQFAPVLAASFVFYTAGALAAARALKVNVPAQASTFVHQPMAAGSLAAGRFAFAMWAAVLMGLLYAFGGGETGLAFLFSQARQEDVLKEFRAGFSEANPYAYAGAIVNNVVGPLLLLVAVNRWRLSRAPLWLAHVAILLAVLVLTSTASLQKGPLIFIVLYLVVNRYLTGHAHGGRQLVVALAVVVTLGMAGYYVTYELAPLDALVSTISRLTVVPQLCLDGFLHVYPDYLPHDSGLGVGLVATMTGQRDYVSPPVLVGIAVTGKEGVSFNAFWATEMWASFGMAGVVGGSLLAGALMVLLDWYCLRRAKTTISLALYSFLIVRALQLPSGSLFTGLLSGGMVLGPLLLPLIEEWPSSARPRPSDPPGSS